MTEHKEENLNWEGKGMEISEGFLEQNNEEPGTEEWGNVNQTNTEDRQAFQVER